MTTTLNYTGSEFAELAKPGDEIFLAHEDADGGAIHGRILGHSGEAGYECVAIRRIGATRVEHLRVGLVGEWVLVAR